MSWSNGTGCHDLCFLNVLLLTFLGTRWTLPVCKFSYFLISEKYLSLIFHDSICYAFCISSVQSHNLVRLFATPWTATHEASLSITNSQSLLKFMSVESVMPSSHLILCPPLLLLPSVFPSISVFSNKSVVCIRQPNTGVSPSASVLPMNIQDWFPLRLTDLISW